MLILYQAVVIKQTQMHLDICDRDTDIKLVGISTGHRWTFLYISTETETLCCHVPFEDGKVKNFCAMYVASCIHLLVTRHSFPSTPSFFPPPRRVHPLTIYKLTSSNGQESIIGQQLRYEMYEI
jgi:hypothetical protein